jgi:hypothetical protein
VTFMCGVTRRFLPTASSTPMSASLAGAQVAHLQ